MQIVVTQAELLPIYSQLLTSVQIRAKAAIEAARIRDRIIRNLSAYRNLELKTKIPWWWIASIHSLECDLDFTQHLANGDPIDDVTYREPIGIPGGTWEECAIAALTLKSWLFDEINWGDPSSCLYAAERYNGMGYRLYHPDTLSPYLWSGTSHYSKGKYVADGKWSDTAVSSQVGAVPIWMALGVIQPATNQSVSVSDVSNLGGIKVRPNYLIDVAANYKGLEHQKAALGWLQSNISDGILNKFKDEFSPPMSGSIATAAPATPKFSTECAADQYKKLCGYAKSGVANIDTKTTYYSQRDNYTMGGRTCNSSASAMLLDWWRRAAGMEALGGDDEYLRKVLEIGDTIYHENQTDAIAKYGFKSKWISPVDEPTKEDFDRVDGLLDNGFPVTVNILHRGSENAPTGGHVILLIARRKSEGTYVSHDPYGNFGSGYKNPNGRFSLISRNSFRNRWQGGHRVLA